MEYLSISLCLLQFLLTMFVVQCIGLSHPLLSLFLGILFSLMQLQIEFFFTSFSEISLLVYRNTLDFYILILYPATSLYLFLIVVLVASLEFSLNHLQLHGWILRVSYEVK